MRSSLFVLCRAVPAVPSHAAVKSQPVEEEKGSSLCLNTGMVTTALMHHGSSIRMAGFLFAKRPCWLSGFRNRTKLLADLHVVQVWSATTVTGRMKTRGRERERERAGAELGRQRDRRRADLRGEGRLYHRRSSERPCSVGD